MLDFTQGGAWFAGGLGLTFFFVLPIVVFAVLANASWHHRASDSREGDTG